MAEDALVTALHHFIAQCIGSVEQLEVLCLLAESPEKVWSAQEVFRVVQSSEKSVSDCLQCFLNQGFLSVDAAGGYRFAPKKPESGHAVGALIKAYRERRVTVIEMIYRKPNDSLHDFANAFKLRK